MVVKFQDRVGYRPQMQSSLWHVMWVDRTTLVIGMSLSETHTSKSNFHIYIYIYFNGNKFVQSTGYTRK